MAAITFSADGANVYIAAEGNTGDQVIFGAAASDLSAWAKTYEPLAGSAANVLADPANPDQMFFYGNFGTNVVLLRYDISAATTTDLSPASQGSNAANGLAINPSNPDELVLGIGTAQDLKYSNDGGATWSDWDAALGLDPTALAVLWSGAYAYHRYFVAGQVTGAAELDYSPCEGLSSANVTGSLAAANIVSLEATES